MMAADRVLRDWLGDIEADAGRVVERTREATFDQFIRDELVQDSVIRRFQDIGEAARYIALLHVELYRRTDLPWQFMRALRNRLAHGYSALDLEIVWRTAREDVPSLLERVRDLIAREPDS